MNEDLKKDYDRSVEFWDKNYLSPEIAKSKDYTVKEDRYLFVDKILRLVLMSDEEWTSLLSEYFTVTKLDHFSWPGEETETRRLFFLQNE
ncbi:hypothetical protein NXH67_15125 [Butyrivibrio sp. DSM 10294]|uniref:hypothetical protein n=1 Tax=Butyrivibrio sp. DSM 10294 TaxID=2972457 RepID=UPI00234F736B|nr:hypothetical protein [Butyrivibrio sp. DSM 10294]MDC7294848.1 hypothetical protein [Butyrivibrio sp. DSM 10294]